MYGTFRRNELRCLVLSKVGNFAIDLPDADVLIQVSGAFGSRQEEAQRLGRILRPKGDGRAAHFFSLVSHDTREEEFAHHRKLFLTEQVTRTGWSCWAKNNSRAYNSSKKNASRTRSGLPSIPGSVLSPPRNPGTGFRHSSAGSTVMPYFPEEPQFSRASL